MSVSEYILKRFATPEGKSSRVDNCMGELVTPNGKSSDFFAMHMGSMTPSPPCKRMAPDHGGPRFRLRKSVCLLSDDEASPRSPAPVTPLTVNAASNSQDTKGSPAPVTPLGAACKSKDTTGSETPSLLAWADELEIWDLPTSGVVTPPLLAICDAGPSTSGMAPVMPAAAVLCDGTMTPEDDRMMWDLFGEIVVLKSPLLVRTRPVEQPGGDLGKMLEELNGDRPSWLGLDISGDLGAHVRLDDALAVARACFRGLEASAVGLRAERRAKGHDAQCFITLACKYHGKQVGSSIVRPDNEGTFTVQDIVRPALVWRCVALAAKPPANAAACAELCAVAKASLVHE